MSARLRLSKKWLNAAFLSFYGFRLSHSLPGGETRKVRKPLGFHPFRRTCRQSRIKHVYICPERNYLEYATTDRNGYREYKCRNSRCADCPRRQECLTEKQKTKSLRRHVWEDFKDEAYRFTHSETGSKIYKR